MTTASRFYPHLKDNPNSRFANLSEVLRGHISSLINDAEEPTARAEDRSHKPQQTAAPSGATRQEPAKAARQENVPAAAPKPMPVPANIEAMGPACADAYRQASRRETQRLLALVALSAARGKHIAVCKLASQNLSDAEILARLPQQPSDQEQRAMMRQAEIGAMWDRAIARVFGQPVPKADLSADSADIWERAIAANNPGYRPAASPSSASGDVWDRVYARVFTKN